MDAPPVLPTYDGPDAERVFARSRAHWQQALAQATAMSKKQKNTSAPAAPATPESLDVMRVLFRTPALPDTLPHDADRVSGVGVWIGASLRPCTAHRTLQGTKEDLWLRAKHRISVTVAPAGRPSSFAHWPGTPHNGVAWLALGWAYVLSASLAERQSVGIEYSEADATHGRAGGRAQPTVSLPYATPTERRWWRAVTALGVGWARADGELTPWSVDVAEAGLGLLITGVDLDVDVMETPPTARQAAHYLARLCAFFRLGSQCSAALAAVLVFPLHAPRPVHDMNPICLPRPRLGARGRPRGRRRGRGRGRVHGDTNSHGDDALPDEFAYLSYFMTLSLSRFAMGSSLWSVFWESDVPCHLAGAWVQPAAAVLLPILRTEAGTAAPDADLELLAKVLSLTGTRAAPLWLGAALCGYGRVVRRIGSYLTNFWPSDYTAASITVAAWMGEWSHFFHNLSSAPVPLPVKDADTVPRVHVWRLRRIFSSSYPRYANFEHMPINCWPPFGVMRVDDVELEIRAHVSCGHRWLYAHWVWLVDGAASHPDRGFCYNKSAPMPKPPPHPPQPRPKPDAPLDAPLADALKNDPISPAAWDSIRALSKAATETIFWWANSQVERGLGTLVQRTPDPGDREKPPQSPRRPKEYNPASVEAWRQGVVPSDTPCDTPGDVPSEE